MTVVTPIKTYLNKLSQLFWDTNYESHMKRQKSDQLVFSSPSTSYMKAIFEFPGTQITEDKGSLPNKKNSKLSKKIRKCKERYLRCISKKVLWYEFDIFLCYQNTDWQANSAQTKTKQE